jgi:hypothetical protein
LTFGYSYASSNPVSFADPSGEDVTGIFKIIAGAIMSLESFFNGFTGLGSAGGTYGYTPPNGIPGPPPENVPTEPIDPEPPIIDLPL